MDMQSADKVLNRKISTVKFGITFSHPHTQYLGLHIGKSFRQALSLGFSHIRLGTYWNRIEVREGIYDFSEVKRLLEESEKAGQKIVMTVGVKAPRWPEFYWPKHHKSGIIFDQHAQEKTLSFICATVTELKGFSCITHWQVENEPFDPSGPDNISISMSFLERETLLVRSIDSRPILINLWGNDVVKRGYFQSACNIADVVGLDLYYNQFVGKALGKSFYTGPRQSDNQLGKLLSQTVKPVWITELQAEPWEADQEAYLGQNPSSISINKLRENIIRASSGPYREILLWGFEYWLYRAAKGDSSYLDEVVRLCRLREIA